MYKKIARIFKKIGPGVITGASDDDPSGIATYSQTGAQFGYTQLWTALFSFPIMTAIQEMCARIGLVTGTGLSAIVRRHYPKTILYFSVLLLLVANTINIGADLGAMAASLEMVSKVHFVFWLILITVITLTAEVFISYKRYSKFLKWLTLSLFAYILAALVVKQDWIAIVKNTLIPTISFSKDYLMNIVAILGTTISPYLYFWQEDTEVEEEIAEGKIKSMESREKPKVNKLEIRHMHTDVTAGMFLSNLVMFFIIITTASTLGKADISSIESAPQAAQTLAPIAGNFAYLLFAAGIVGTGLLAVPVLAGSAAYAFSEAFGWKEGLEKKFIKARGFYSIIIISTLLGFILNFLGINPIKALYYTAVVNGIIAPPLLILIVLIASNPKIMGDKRNGIWSNTLGIITIVVMTISAAALIYTLITGYTS